MPIDIPGKPKQRSPSFFRASPVDVPEHDIPLNLLLQDAAEALGLVQLHALARACRIADAILSGTPVLGESFVGDIVELIEVAKQHAHSDNEDSRVLLIAALDKVETWGLPAERRMHNAVREIVATMETIRQIATTRHSPAGTMAVAQLAERSLGVLGFEPFRPNVLACKACDGEGEIDGEVCAECDGEGTEVDDET